MKNAHVALTFAAALVACSSSSSNPVLPACKDVAPYTVPDANLGVPASGQGGRYDQGTCVTVCNHAAPIECEPADDAGRDVTCFYACPPG